MSELGIAPAPLSVTQVGTFFAVAGRELAWVLPGVAKLVANWRTHASAIPDRMLRADALSTLADERFNTEGAALFATLPTGRSEPLLRVLVALEVIWDYLDTVSERPCEDMVRNGLQLHRALEESLDPGGPISDYYRYNPSSDDGGYLRTLVEECRTQCVKLPSFELVRPHAIREARRGQVCAINHEPNPAERDDRLRAWVAAEYPRHKGFAWFELSGAASSSLTVHALLALAAQPHCTKRDVARTYAAYFPWIALASTMLDSYADRADDLEVGAHSYVSHYRSPSQALTRLREIVATSVRLAHALPRGERHALIAAGMVPMYLTKKEMRAPCHRAAAASLLRAAGPLPTLQWPILRTWRLIA